MTDYFNQSIIDTAEIPSEALIPQNLTLNISGVDYHIELTEQIADSNPVLIEYAVSANSENISTIWVEYSNGCYSISDNGSLENVASILEDRLNGIAPDENNEDPSEFETRSDRISPKGELGILNEQLFTDFMNRLELSDVIRRKIILNLNKLQDGIRPFRLKGFQNIISINLGKSSLLLYQAKVGGTLITVPVGLEKGSFTITERKAREYAITAANQLERFVEV